MAYLIIDFKPVEERCFHRVEAERSKLFFEPIALFRIMVRVVRFDVVAPSLDLFRRFSSSVAVDPLHHLVVASTLLDLGFKLVARYAFETKEHVVEGTVEVVLAEVAPDQGTAFIKGPSQNGVAADANPRTSGRFLR